MKQFPVYISGNGNVYKVNAPIHCVDTGTRWYGPVGHIVETEYDGQKSRYYSPNRSQGLPQPSSRWTQSQGCE